MSRVITVAIVAVLLSACDPGPAPKYKPGDVVYSYIGHFKGQITELGSYNSGGYTYWVRFMTISMEGHQCLEPELCKTPKGN
jgi:hypothetical protein